MFKNKLVDLGKIKAGKKVEFIIENSDYANDITRIKPSCGCTSSSLDNKTGNIKVVFKPEAVPYHLKAQGYYNVTKFITVFYYNGSTDILSIKASIYE